MLDERRVLFFSSLPVLIWQLASLPRIRRADAPRDLLQFVIDNRAALPVSDRIRELVLVADLHPYEGLALTVSVSESLDLDPRGMVPPLRIQYAGSSITSDNAVQTRLSRDITVVYLA
ncbi:hypothetical protein AMAG_19033 [Allomyces macrogynus ATCC 38327]|uniref:Uncharacterized protein n=1 Tax=Allomyces macrogynus (strain ATCC 38327) TaxID=578462 RepID=A0A0L0SMS6_ALLM3|nr:hypothetical protein AMAG_19033 [Allomyces macrogynus ATCC 38327]|eukprot:KNE63679.1 hypothetical protein AMAG_19033 [Allomyces macrogynus ATCC 38327]